MLVEIKVFPENTNQYDNLMIKKKYSTRLTKFVSFYSWQITELLFTDKSPLLQANCFINTVHLSHGCSDVEGHGFNFKPREVQDFQVS